MSHAVPLHVDAPVRASVDVAVVGSGPSGLSAAISAARRGARTLLIERFGYVGGNLTAGLVGPCMTSYSLDGSTQLIKGVFEELVLRMEADGQAIHPSKVPANSPYCGYITYGHDKVTPFEPEAVKATGLEMLQEAGVEILFHTTVIAPRTEGDQVTGLFIASKSGIEAIDAKVVVDCSADADVVAGAGAPTHYGRDEDGLAQPMTLFCRVAGVDDAAVDEALAGREFDVVASRCLAAEHHPGAGGQRCGRGRPDRCGDRGAQAGPPPDRLPPPPGPRFQQRHAAGHRSDDRGA